MGKGSILTSPTLSRLASPTAEATTTKKTIEKIQIVQNVKEVIRKIQTPANILVSRKTPRPRRIDGGWDLSLVNGRRKAEKKEEEDGEQVLFFEYVLTIISVDTY